ncbi:MAG: Stp1/IreP family PP2C-type Ser/Thr phosphatase [Actinobacteria bacterium]|nr:Stp1/IreP family PP2C-type Ser/Thr phosphatase [Actinomycetota bacterium]
MISATYGATTHVGQVRTGNEDSYIAIDGLYFVADGMGGHRAGEVASDIAVRTLAEIYLSQSSPLTSPGLVSDAISTANTAIYMEAMHDPDKNGMGTTLTGLVVINPLENKIVVANVGDSRTYLWRHNELHQVTKDHSHVQTLVDRGVISRAEARVHFQRNIVLRAMGIDSWVLADVEGRIVEDGDRYILCSDGLVDEADDAEIENEIRASVSAQDLSDRLVNLANRNGGRDNITVVVVDFEVVPSELITAPESNQPSESIVESPLIVEPPSSTTSPSPWFRVGAYAMWLAAAAITVTVILSAITSAQ